MALQNPARHLRPGLEIEALQRFAAAVSDTDMTRHPATGTLKANPGLGRLGASCYD